MGLMRFSEDKIKAGILHPLQDARGESVLYFSRSYTQDTSIMPLAIQAIEKYGWSDAFLVPCNIEGLPLDDATLPWVLHEIQRENAKTPDRYGSMERWHTLHSLLANADAHLLARHQQVIASIAVLESEVQSIVSRRIAMLSRDGETCWRELEKFCFLAKDVEKVGDVDLDYAYALIEAIAREKEQYAKRVLSILAEKIEDLESNPKVWMAAFAVRMAGGMRLESAIPLIIAKLKESDEEAEWVAEQCDSALVQIGGDATIHAVADMFRQGAWDSRMAACNVLHHVHSDLAVSTALDFLPSEKDPTIRAFLATALAFQFVSEAIEPLRQIVIDGTYDETLADVKRDVVVAATLMGAECAEMEQWESEVETKRLEFETKRLEQGAQILERELRRLKQETQRLKLEKKMLEQEKRQLVREVEEQDEEPPRKKIGRNDPCPCGSGKKFKKCGKRWVKRVKVL
jgi:hypothetical protein